MGLDLTFYGYAVNLDGFAHLAAGYVTSGFGALCLVQG